VKLVIYSCVYNESKYLPEMLESLAEGVSDCSVVISDNYSTDDSLRILKTSASRFDDFEIIAPPHHCTSLEHHSFTLDYLHREYPDCSHAVFIGGHDRIGSSYLTALKNGVADFPDAAVIYTNTFRMGHQGELLYQYPNNINTAGVSTLMVPPAVLLGITHNTPSSGAMRLSSLAIPNRHCCASDHLWLAEQAMSGEIVFCEGGSLFLRDAPTFVPGWNYYVDKHISKSNIARGAEYDFALQLDWLIEILRAGVNRECLKPGKSVDSYYASMIWLYMYRYSEIARGFPDGTEFLASPLVNAARDLSFEKVRARIDHLLS
jgi:glycosyltransferase involved in cell wall biosynthesis